MLYIGILTIIFGVDVIIKTIVDKKMAFGEKKTYVKGKIIVQKYYNKGFALDRFEKHPKLVAYGSGFICSLLIVQFCLLLFQKGKKGMKTALAMIIGGAASNVYDRFCKKHVIDYVRFGVRYKPLRKIVFNLSDFAILLGAMLLTIFYSKENN